MNPPNKVTYSNEKLREFIPVIQKDINDSNKVLTTLQSKVFDVTFRSIIENPQLYSNLLSQIQQMTQVVSKKVDKYMSLTTGADLYASPIADQVEKLSNELDNIYLAYSRLEDTLETLIELAGKNN